MRNKIGMKSLSPLIGLIFLLGLFHPGIVIAADSLETEEKIATTESGDTRPLNITEGTTESMIAFKGREGTGVVKENAIAKSNEELGLETEFDFNLYPDRISQWEFARSGITFSVDAPDGTIGYIEIAGETLEFEVHWLFDETIVGNLSPGTHPVTVTIGNTSKTKNLIIVKDEDFWEEPSATPSISTRSVQVLTKSEAERLGTVRVYGENFYTPASLDVLLNGTKVKTILSDFIYIDTDIDIQNLPVGEHTIEFTHPTGSATTTFVIIPNEPGTPPAAGIFEGLTYQHTAGSEKLTNPLELPVRFEVDENGVLRNLELEYWWLCHLGGESGFLTADNIPPTRITVNQPFQIDWDYWGYSFVGVINDDGTASGSFGVYDSACGIHAADWDLVSDQASDLEVERIAGTSRYSTAIEVSQRGWNSADTVIIARGDDFADALSGVPLAHKLDAPVLMTVPDRLLDNTMTEIRRLGAKNIVILGGEEAVSKPVADELKNSGLNVRRISGSSRFETAALIASEVAPNGANKVVVANGMDFPDALSVASSAAKEGLPILLTLDDRLPAATDAKVKELAVKETIVVGGESVVSETIRRQLPQSIRLSGNDRYGTNIAIAEHFGVDNNHLYVATGQNYADALTGAVLAAKDNSTILLVHHRVPSSVTTYLNKHQARSLSIFGGEDAVSVNVENELRKLLR